MTGRRHITAALVLGAMLSLAGQAHGQRKSPEERYEDMKKSPLLAASVEWVSPLAGHDYAGDKRAGLPPFFLMAGGFTMFFGAVVAVPACKADPAANCRIDEVVGILGVLTVLASRIWASVSAWRLANRTNAYHRERLGLDDAALALPVTPAGQFGLGASLRF